MYQQSTFNIYSIFRLIFIFIAVYSSVCLYICHVNLAEEGKIYATLRVPLCDLVALLVLILRTNMRKKTIW